MYAVWVGAKPIKTKPTMNDPYSYKTYTSYSLTGGPFVT